MADQPTSMERLIQGILPENPVYRQLLGLCPTLAVTSGMKAAITMSCAVAFVLLSANVIVSLIRNLLKPHLRIVIFTLTIATFVTIADRILAAYMYQMSKTLGPYVPLIIVNCIILCRCEVCASKQPLLTAVSDAVGQAAGFALALSSIAAVREILGTGMFFEIRVLPTSWPDWVIMVLPPGAFLTLGLLLGAVNWMGSLHSKNRQGKEGVKKHELSARNPADRNRGGFDQQFRSPLFCRDLSIYRRFKASRHGIRHGLRRDICYQHCGIFELDRHDVYPGARCSPVLMDCGIFYIR